MGTPAKIDDNFSQQQQQTMSQEDEVALSYIRDRSMLAQHNQIPEASWGLFVILDPIRDELVVNWIRRDYKRAKALTKDENISLMSLPDVTNRAEDEGSYAACIIGQDSIVSYSIVDE